MIVKKDKYRIEKSSDDNLIVSVEIDGKSLPLHSRRFPMKESSKSNFNLQPNKYDMLIILGYGMGYAFLNELENLKLFKKILVIDILAEIEEEIAENQATNFILSLDNLEFISGASIDKLESLFRSVIDFEEFKGIQVVEHAASFRIFNGYYDEVKTGISRLIDEMGRNKVTVSAFGKIFFRNAVNNLLGKNDIKPVSLFFEEFNGENALIVSSAPSLEKYIEYISVLSPMLFIIAVDSALPVLRAHNIDPDFVISIDPQGVIGEHLLDMDETEAIFINSVVSPPEELRKFNGYMSLNSHPLAQVFDELTQEKTGSIDSSTGSVAGDALAFAISAGFDQIGMVGFDFSFSGNRIYSRGTAYQKRYSRYFNNRLRTPETFNSDYIFKSSGSFISNGSYTRKSFLEYKNSLGNFVARCDRDDIYFINSENLMPENMKCSDMKSFIEKLENTNPNKIEKLNRFKKYNEDKFYKSIRNNFIDILDNDKILEQIVDGAFGGRDQDKYMEYAKKIISRKKGLSK